MRTGGQVGVGVIWRVPETVAEVVGVWVLVGCNVADAPLSGVGDEVSVGVPVRVVGDRDGVIVALDVMLGVSVLISLAVAVGVNDGEAVCVGEWVVVGDGEGVLVSLGVLLGIGVSVTLPVAVGVNDGVAVTVGECVAVTVGLAVAVGEIGAKASL